MTRGPVGGSGTTFFHGVEQVALYGGAGNDIIDASVASFFITVLDGNGGNDSIVGSESADYLAGGDGNDTLRGNGGGDTLTDDVLGQSPERRGEQPVRRRGRERPLLARGWGRRPARRERRRRSERRGGGGRVRRRARVRQADRHPVRRRLDRRDRGHHRHHDHPHPDRIGPADVRPQHRTVRGRRVGRGRRDRRQRLHDRPNEPVRRRRERPHQGRQRAEPVRHLPRQLPAGDGGQRHPDRRAANPTSWAATTTAGTAARGTIRSSAAAGTTYS